LNIFRFRNELISDYAAYSGSFLNIRDSSIRAEIERRLDSGELWPKPLIQLNPAFEPGPLVDELVEREVLHRECGRIFRRDKTPESVAGQPLRLFSHQHETIDLAHRGRNYVLTTGTGSGKSLSYIVPIVDHVLRRGSGKGIQAIIVYPMNALANSQEGELKKFLNHGYPPAQPPVTFKSYTGQNDIQTRQEILKDPPDILLTNYVMLELILTRPNEDKLVEMAAGLQFLVLDELHTYRGRQGSDVAMLVRRLRELVANKNLQCVGTSATIAGANTFAEQQREVSALATELFGVAVEPGDVVGESLRRKTEEADLESPQFRARLRDRVADPSQKPPNRYEDFIRDPLSVWIENTFGVRTDSETHRLVRSKPCAVDGPNGAATRLSQITQLDEIRCVERIQEGLAAGYDCEPHPETGFPVFAFRLHQFISGGDAIYASFEPGEERYTTIHGQRYVPADDSQTRRLFPLCFCRECGQEYYTVWRRENPHSGRIEFESRDLLDRASMQGAEPGFLYLSSQTPWPSDEAAQRQRLPADWLEEDDDGPPRVLRGRRDDVPRSLHVHRSGHESSDGLDCAWIGSPFRFCLHCGISFDSRSRSDFANLTSLGSEKRSSATTILSLAAVRGLRRDPDLKPIAHKLLSFTDNRQDASLQAGHLNDFVEIGLARSALYQAAQSAGSDGLSHDVLTSRVFDQLLRGLDRTGFASNPEPRFAVAHDTDRAFRDVIGYRLYRDLRRGWRVTSPNLEQCGLLRLDYLSLDELCEANDRWREIRLEHGRTVSIHEALARAEPTTRAHIARVLLDYLRRQLAISVSYLDPREHDALRRRSDQRLVAPWAIDDEERLEGAGCAFPRQRVDADDRAHTFISGRSGFGRFLARRGTLPAYNTPLSLIERDAIIGQLCHVLAEAGLLRKTLAPRFEDDVPGYQVESAAVIWKAGDGQTAFHDPIRVPNLPDDGLKTNSWFVEFYKDAASVIARMHAREHTAQVPADDRKKREEDFGDARLPILYCSPTMELGIDIKDLNAVNLRNVPPTPANYAQRSGRAGRSGQPAMVFTYCAAGSGHDQYFFKRPERMVSGQVATPRLDLTNEDLLRAHMHAVWLRETGLDLKTSLADLLDLGAPDLALPLLSDVRQSIENPKARTRALTRGASTLAPLRNELSGTDWFRDDWLETEVLAKTALHFDLACNRWRDAYRAAFREADAQHRIELDHTRTAGERDDARRRRAEALSRLKLLTDPKNVIQSDFYSYRYFASEGFLPGYNFPRLPLSAFIPSRRMRQGQKRDDYLSRPRFLAISEFGPDAVIYHEGSRYRVNRVILPVGAGEDIHTRHAQLCPACGYLHPLEGSVGMEKCERCDTSLDAAIPRLFRMENVSTVRRDKINSDEGERLRLGYDIRSGVRFAERQGRTDQRNATVHVGDEPVARLTYGAAATIWRVNFGWRRRAEDKLPGFVLDLESGRWMSEKALGDGDDAPPTPQRKATRTARVIPFVDDRRNALVFEPSAKLTVAQMASLQAALKRGIQIEFQLEDNELATEPLPTPQDRRLLLFYEAAEGGAGVLRHLAQDRTAIRRVARTALELCHFDPDTGADRQQAQHAKEPCVVACYDCLMSYYNQLDHEDLNRHEIQPILLQLARGELESAPVETARAEHLATLLRLCEEDSEREWLRFVDERDLRLPSHAQHFVERAETRPDFFYEDGKAAIYVDGSYHDFAHRQAKDRELDERLEILGFTPIRFGVRDDWPSIIRRFPGVFGKLP